MNHLRFMSLVVVLLGVPALSYGAIAYMPQELRSYMFVAYDKAGKADQLSFLEEACKSICEGRAILSDTIIRKAVDQASAIVHDDQAICDYFKNYLNSLEDKTVLLNMQGKENARRIFPTSLSSDDMEILQLSSWLTTENNLSLSGYHHNDAVQNDGAAYKHAHSFKSVKPNKMSDPGLSFNANMLTSTMAVTPNTLFGTGIAMPTINAWSMVSSNQTQSPVNMQFSIPSDLKTEKAMTVELHFLVSKQGFASGKARIRVNGLYVSNGDEFASPSSGSFSFTHTTDSKDFVITEPTVAGDLVQVMVTIPIEKSHIGKSDFALLSLTRIAPKHGAEYAGNIFLAASAFRYTQVTG